MNLNGSFLPRPSNGLNQVVEIKRVQKILRILICCLLTFSVFHFFLVLFSLSQGHRISTYEPIPILIWVLFFAGGLLVTEQLYLYGLFVFAWFGIINIICTCSAIVSIAVGVVIITSHRPLPRLSLPYTIIPVVAYLTCVILDAIIVIFAFKLAYLIKKTRRLALRNALG